MKEMVSGFIHRLGVHCATTAFRDILEYGGFPLSEDMCFGLGAGLGFIYWKDKRLPFPFVGGRSKDLEEELCRNLGIGMRTRETRSRKKAYTTLRESILRNQPALINVDLHYLPYFWGGKRPPPGAHFGGHFIVVVAIDESKEIAFVADTNFSGLQEIKLKDLEEARDSKHRPFPSRNRWYILDFPRKLIPLDKAIKKALTNNCRAMLNSPIRNLGLKGMKYFARDIVNWPREISSSSLKAVLLNTYIYMEEDGTGGGLFRRLYARFLKEAGELLKNQALKELSRKYEEIADYWSDLAGMFREASKTSNSGVFIKAQPKILELASWEERALFCLNRVCKRL